MSSGRTLGRIDPESRGVGGLTAVRFGLPLGWALAGSGYFGPWIGHATAALTLSGVDMGEFVKFLPEVMDGSLNIVRQLLYAPPFVVVVSVAFLIGSRRLRYPWLVRIPVMLLAIPVSLQLLPPAWSLASLTTPEFRVQTAGLLLSWLLLAAFWLLGRLPAWLAGAVSAIASLAAAVLSTWQFLLSKPAVDRVYGIPPTVGWGFWLCQAGLVLIAVLSGLLVWQTLRRSGRAWARR